VIIAIDGPAASGKSTVAKAVARRLGMHYLDTGAMYRALAWLALERGVPADDAGQLAALAFAHPVTFAYEDASTLPTGVYIADHDVTVAIRQPEVDAAVRAVASVPEVFPDAELKVFLTASADERARRRRIDLAGAGHDVDTNEVRERLERRDHADSTREASPLDIAEDAQRLDTTGLSAEEVVERIAILAGERR
jgi:cytidylate kinase